MKVNGKSLIMKNLYLLVVATLVILTACHKVDVFVSSIGTDELYAAIEDLVSTKTMMNDNNSICWQRGV